MCIPLFYHIHIWFEIGFCSRLAGIVSPRGWGAEAKCPRGLISVGDLRCMLQPLSLSPSFPVSIKNKCLSLSKCENVEDSGGLLNSSLPIKRSVGVPAYLFFFLFSIH